MNNLLKIEWLKIKNYGAFKILIIFFSIGVLLTNYIVYSVNKNMVGAISDSTGGIIGKFSPYDFANTWQTTSYATGYLLILPAMLLIILITNEYSFRTSRQNIIDGWSRSEFIAVKLMLALLIAVFATLLVVFTALVFGLFSGSSFSTNGIENLGFFFLKALSYNVIAVFLSVALKKTGLVIGLYFIYLGAENIISQLLDIWSIKLKADGVGDFGSMGDYLPMNAADGLLRFPDNPLKSLAQNSLPSNYFWIVLVCAIVYLILFTWWSRRIFIKSDL